ncbi:MAG: CoA pyrophosphatase [Rhodospirillaceae bacterium]|nr:CoA pyrophosphatase [Rhodospirillaceae bacterium]MBL6929999.1 CoA pyrophosphatase [Rhodospirillales bacterium]MBL6941074.1 CoA pyrophosphatase [Rhodospirillales bacterium]
MIRMTHPLFPLDRDWLAGNLDQSATAPEQAPRGDHDLNPGTRTGSPLTAAAVLVPLVTYPDTTMVLMTRRTDHLANHPGQVSFPGGHIEPDDGSPEETAIRETEEETGIARNHVEVIGRLDDYETRTGFRVTPVVALLTPPFEVSPDTHEVAEVFEVPLAFLLDPANHQRHAREFEGTERQFFAMPYKQHFIWGATAGMLINLYEVLKE